MRGGQTEPHQDRKSAKPEAQGPDAVICLRIGEKSHGGKSEKKEIIKQEATTFNHDHHRSWGNIQKGGEAGKKGGFNDDRE